MCPSRRVPCNMWRQAAWHRWCNSRWCRCIEISPASSAHDYILSVHPRGDEQDEQYVNCRRCTHLTGQGTSWQRYSNASCTPARGLNSGGVRSPKTLTLWAIYHHISHYQLTSAPRPSPRQRRSARLALQFPSAPRFLLATATEMLILLYKPPDLTIQTWITFCNSILVASMNSM